MKKWLLATFISAASISPFVSAGPVYFTSQRVLGFNAVSESSYYGTDLVAEAYAWQTDGSTSTTSLSGTKQISGVDRNGDSATMSLEYSTESEVSSGGVLKAKASAYMSDGFYNSSNSPFVTNTNFDTDPNGVPDNIYVQSSARFADDIYVQGGANLSYVQFDFHIDGKFTGDAGALYVYPGSGGGNLFSAYTWDGEEIDGAFSTGMLEVINGVVRLDLTMYAEIGIDLELLFGEFGESEGSASYFGGSVDFFNTLTLTQLSGFDSAGNAVDLISATDSSNNQFTTTRIESQENTVPVPPTLILFLSGLVFLFRNSSKSLSLQHL